MALSTRTIAIVGAGFSGSALAAKLLRFPPQAPTRLLLFERASQLGTGVAYARHPHPYLLNVPAARMSAIPEDPYHFVAYARQHNPNINGDSYLTRAFYGQYLQHHLAQAEAAAPSHIQLERVRCEITALSPLDLTGAVVIRARDRQWLADQVVLACGDPPPRPKSYAAAVKEHRAFIHEPFAAERIQPSDRHVLIIGTGPTMADMITAAVAVNPHVTVIAVSRHGLIPQSQTSACGAKVVNSDCPGFEAPAGATLRQIVSAVRNYVRTVQVRSFDWRDAVTALRKSVPALWEGLSDRDRSRYLRHVRAHWDVHRHRLPPELASKIGALRASGQLQIRAGRVLELVADGARIEVQWRPRGRVAAERIRVDRVIDCSGSDSRILHTKDPLLRHLLDSGVATPDPNGLGLRTGEHGALISRDGELASQLFYVGPMLRAQHWEATAVGELRHHVDSLAKALRTMPARAPALSQRPISHHSGFTELQASR
jgi:uncharacterized NAD(P)/FAD-binding protein YdhS